MKALETTYGGCRFRSRLEARWAVFLDHLGIRWEYEPQGFVIGDDKSWSSFRPRPYLPDFYLPDLRLWVEVKGAIEALDLELVVNAAIPHWGLPSGTLLLLGDIPRPMLRPVHSHLTFHEGDVSRDWLEFQPTGKVGIVGSDDRVGNDHGETFEPDPDLLRPAYLGGAAHQRVLEAYTAARRARFEHGQAA